MYYNNIYNSIKRELDCNFSKSSSSTSYGTALSSPAPIQDLPNFNLSEKSNFAIKILNQNNQTVLEKIFDSEQEFQMFCDNCIQIENVGFFSTSFKTARVNSIADFAKTFFFPTTTLYPIEPAAYLLTIIWDLSSLLCRLLTLPYRFYEYHNAPEHPLLVELRKSGLVKDSAGPYLDVHFRAKRYTSTQKADVHLGERIFFEQHTRHERSRYCNSEIEILSSFHNYSFKLGENSSHAQETSTAYPNPTTKEAIQKRWAEEPFVPPTIKEARDFFGLKPGFTKNELDRNFRQKMLAFHPDKIKDDGSCGKWVNKCREVLC